MRQSFVLSLQNCWDYIIFINQSKKKSVEFWIKRNSTSRIGRYINEEIFRIKESRRSAKNICASFTCTTSTVTHLVNQVRGEPLSMRKEWEHMVSISPYSHKDPTNTNRYRTDIRKECYTILTDFNAVRWRGWGGVPLFSEYPIRHPHFFGKSAGEI